MNSTHHSSFSSLRHQQGLTLVEILVALVISLFLTAGVIQLFIGTKQTYRFHDALSRLQENGRFALDRMAWDIRMANFNMGNWTSLPPPPPNGAIFGVETTDANNYEIDSINLAWVDGGNQTRVYDIADLAGTPNCSAAENSLRLNSNGSGLQQLVEGVQRMRLLYGVCAGGVVTPPYVTAGNVPAAGGWGNVCSVRIHLLLISLEDNVVTQPQTVNFPADSATQVNCGGRCLCQAFSTTVRIRNR